MTENNPRTVEDLINQDRIVYLVYTYIDFGNELINPILYADWKLADEDILKRKQDIKHEGHKNMGIRTIYLSPALGEYKTFSEYAAEDAKNVASSIS